MESLGTAMSLPVEIQKTDLEATAIQIYDSTSADIKTKYIVTFKSISYSKSSPIAAYVAKQPDILTKNNSIPIKKLVDTIGLSYIAFKEGYPGNKILSTYEKDSIASLKENLKNIISRRKV
jgi:hypothetical protein